MIGFRKSAALFIISRLQCYASAPRFVGSYLCSVTANSPMHVSRASSLPGSDLHHSSVFHAGSAFVGINRAGGRIRPRLLGRVSDRSAWQFEKHARYRPNLFEAIWSLSGQCKDNRTVVAAAIHAFENYAILSDAEPLEIAVVIGI